MVADLINKSADILARKNIGYNSKSTEEMVSVIEKYNDKIDNFRNNRRANGRKKLIIGSMDVKALYPSLKVEETVEVVEEMIERSGITIEGADWLEIGKYGV